MTKIKDTSTNFENRNSLENVCAEIYAINLIRGQWVLSICYYLKNNRLRFSELKMKIGAVSERMLALQLKKMEENNLINKYIYAEVPPRVEYELTALGQGLMPILEQLESWGKIHKEQTNRKEI